MSLYTRSLPMPDAGQQIGERTHARATNTVVTDETARRHSAVWACRRLRADLLSTMPVDVYRKIGDLQVEVPKPPVLLAPGGAKVDMHEWLWMSQDDLDGNGNAVGIITAVDGLGLPARVELQDLSTVSVRGKGSDITKWKIEGKDYEPHEVWHERQYPRSGNPLGMSPTMYAAWSINQYLSAQQFSLDWFSGGAIPAASLKNTAKTINPTQAGEIKKMYKATVSAGDVFVHGSDWELKALSATSADAAFLDMQNASIADIARYYGCPVDLIEAAVQSGSITYATISQRNLQLIIMNLGPVVVRREAGLSRMVPKPRFVKLNSDAILRMDPETRAKVLGQKVKDRLLSPSEARAIDNLPPYTEEQYAEFERLFGRPNTKPTAGTGVTS
ncbi:phage portal protein [Lentzea sp. BCCO 10_0798]|uniref:Phage portal protein n=1 Tax=Lentzea kristufekii TaxID=3095430 RepID=A0ABU4TQ59_9PSEU|nr:phage portal protein [Lentzea sp. BCCO 10_0798]MDX8050410.1 phage portal protein [Lentzea sp. BCCO 10_0798]